MMLTALLVLAGVMSALVAWLALRATRYERRLARLLDALPVGVNVMRPDLTTFLLNEAGRDLLGRPTQTAATPAELEAAYGNYVAGSEERYPPERSPMMRALAGSESHADDLEIHRPDGTTVPLETWGRPVLDRTGEVEYGVTAFVDITRRRATERELAEKSQLLDLSTDAIYIRDAQHRITYWNRGATLAYGYSPDEAIGENCFDLLQTLLPEPVDVLEAQLTAEGHWTGEVVQHTAFGQPLTVLSHWVAQHDATGRVSSVLAINTDITKLKDAQQQLQRRAAELHRANRELRRLNADLEQFANAASHDLSEPLRAISGSVALLERRYRLQLDDDADRLIKYAVTGCEQMQALIDDLLAYYGVGRRGELGAVDLDSAEIVAEVCRDLKPAIDEHGAHISIGDLPTVHAVASDLRLVFENLLSNALKFGVPGVAPSVSVAAERLEEFWYFTVSDNGIGVEPRHRERIFGMFKRLHTRDEYPGTGVGLALVQKIIERHGGEIGVTDGPDGVGSTFWFTVPVERRGAR